MYIYFVLIVILEEKNLWGALELQVNAIWQCAFSPLANRLSSEFKSIVLVYKDIRDTSFDEVQWIEFCWIRCEPGFLRELVGYLWLCGLAQENLATLDKCHVDPWSVPLQGPSIPLLGYPEIIDTLWAVLLCDLPNVPLAEPSAWEDGANNSHFWVLSMRVPSPNMSLQCRAWLRRLSAITYIPYFLPFSIGSKGGGRWW